MVRTRVRAFSRFGFPKPLWCSNPDPVVVTCAVRVQKMKEKRPLSLLCFFCVRKDVQLQGRSKMEERAEDVDYCLLLLVDRFRANFV